MTAEQLLGAFEKLRGYVPERLAPRWSVEKAGPMVRVIEPSGFGHVSYSVLGELSEGVPDELILRERDRFAEQGVPVQWMLHSHDLPPDLPERLRMAGFEPTVEGTVLIGEVEELACLDPSLPQGISLHEADTIEDFKQIAALYGEVWGVDYTMTMAGLRREQRDLPDSITMVAARADDGGLISAGWTRYVEGSGFAMLWGGSTAERWRGLGLYRALVAYRAKLALQRGFKHIQVTATDNSRPILERLGMVAVTTAMPHLWTPMEA